MTGWAAAIVLGAAFAAGDPRPAPPKVIVHAAEVPEQPSPDGGTRMRMLFTPAATPDEPTWLGLGSLEPGGSVPEHRHARTTEVLYVLTGSGTLVLEGEPLPIRAGDAIRIPASALHSLCNDGSEVLELLQTFLPPRRIRQKAPPGTLLPGPSINPVAPTSASGPRAPATPRDRRSR